MYLACVQTTSLWRVLMTCFSVSWTASLVARKESSSTLFSLIRRKACQFPGMELDGSTCLRMPLPLFVRVSAFKLSRMYSSQMTSTLIACCSWDVMYGMKTCVAYSQKVSAPPGASMLVIAAPSRMMTSTSGLATFSCGGIISSKHPTRSDFLPSLVLPICDRAGGHAWFSWAKKSSRSPSHIWDAMNNRENREQSFLSDDSWSWFLDFSLTGDRLKRGRLFILIGSVMGFVWFTRRSFRWTPGKSLFGCWNKEINVPWNESWALVELGLWSMLSTAPVVNKPPFSLGGQTAPSNWK